MGQGRTLTYNEHIIFTYACLLFQEKSNSFLASPLMRRENPALWTMNVQYSGITVHLVTKCLIHPHIHLHKEVKQPLDAGLEKSFVDIRDHGLSLKQRKAAASRPMAPHMLPPTTKVVLFLNS